MTQTHPRPPCDLVNQTHPRPSVTPLRVSQRFDHEKVASRPRPFVHGLISCFRCRGIFLKKANNYYILFLGWRKLLFAALESWQTPVKTSSKSLIWGNFIIIVSIWVSVKMLIMQKRHKNSTKYKNYTFVYIWMHFYWNDLGICLVNAWSAANQELDSAILGNKIWGNKRIY